VTARGLEHIGRPPTGARASELPFPQ